MTRAFFFGILVYLLATVCAAPTETAGFNPADLINLLGIGIVSDIHVAISVCPF
jgi:hypothetical protein